MENNRMLWSHVFGIVSDLETDGVFSDPNHPLDISILCKNLAIWSQVNKNIYSSYELDESQLEQIITSVRIESSKMMITDMLNVLSEEGVIRVSVGVNGTLIYNLAYDGILERGIEISTSYQT